MTWTERIDVLCTPGCWIQNHPLSEAWDRELTRLLNSGHRFTKTGRFTARLGTIDVWIANHPYASFTVEDRRPRRATILRAGRLVNTTDTYTPAAPRCHCDHCEADWSRWKDLEAL